MSISKRVTSPLDEAMENKRKSGEIPIGEEEERERRSEGWKLATVTQHISLSLEGTNARCHIAQLRLLGL